jgi:uncharacterized RDD family membrane protein YckC
MLGLIYEALILLAILMAAALPVSLLTQNLPHAMARHLLQLALVAICGWLYTRQWMDGQTLPMKTWKMRLVTTQGMPLSARQAWLRYAALLGSVALLGLGYVWALLDRDRQFLHDRLAGTRLVSLP